MRCRYNFVMFVMQSGVGTDANIVALKDPLIQQSRKASQAKRKILTSFENEHYLDSNSFDSFPLVFVLRLVQKVASDLLKCIVTN